MGSSEFVVIINATFEIDQNPLSKPDDLFTALTGGQKLTVLDLSQAYQQMKKLYVVARTR